MDRARLPSLAAATTIEPFSASMRTSSVTRYSSSPSLPLAVMTAPLTFTSTPSGTVIGFLPTRDITETPLEHAAKNLAANVGGARLMVCHHASRGREDHDAQAIIEARQFLDLRVDPTARLGHARNLAYHRRTVMVLQLDHNLIEPLRILLDAKIPDVALALEDIQHVPAQLRGRRADL